MRTRYVLFASLAVLATCAVALHDRLPLPWNPQAIDWAEQEEPGPYPSDWFGRSRAWPLEHIPQEKVREAIAQARMDRTVARRAAEAARAGLPTNDAAGAFAASGLASLPWTEAGPFNIGGRVAALAVHPGDGTIASGEIVYLASANGGVFKSTNFGVNWTPITDELAVFSMGALAIDEDRPDTVYVGTGEANASVDSYDGNGLYRTQDGGATWEHLGLEATARIARVRIDPSNPMRIFVAAMGQQFSTDSNRGVYRSEDGGATWDNVLFVSDSTGCVDIVMNPANPETLYAAMWERIRRPTYRRAYGPSCRIWRSIDSGDSWQVLSNGLPAPSDNVGRIGLAIAPSQPQTLYAQIITGSAGGYLGLGMYRTDDAGDTWVRKDVSGFTNIFGGFGWYFGDMAVHPLIPDQVMAMGVQLSRSQDGGVTFSTITGSAHVDQHAIWYDPTNPSRIYLGNDGGFYWSTNGASTWNKSVDLPITQFYAGTIDPSDPNRLLGGTQDNNTLLTTGSPSGWFPILGGDGFYCIVDPTNPNVIIAEYQFCCGGNGPARTTGGGFSFPGGINPGTGDRWNWSTPIVMSPHDHNIVLTGSERVWRSINNGASYTPISGDLTTNPPALLTYGTMTTLDISPVSPLIYYAGTDDGQVWRSVDAGATWENISAGLPVRYVTRVTADPVDSMTVYVAHSGFGLDETMPHLHVSHDRGSSWSSVAANLPDAPVNDVLVDPIFPQRLFAGTDVGVYATNNVDGGGWFPLGSGMPLQTVFDLTLHEGSRTLVAATHGRSQWRLDLATLPVAVEPTPVPQRLSLSAPRPNPSRGTTQLSLELASASRVGIDIYDALGRRVRSLAHREFAAGRHTIEWDGRGDGGMRLDAGLYFIRADGGGAVATGRIVRID